MPDVKPPPEVIESSNRWRKLIESAFKSGHRIELQTDNLVELLGFNLAMNRCIEAGVFDEDVKAKKAKKTIQTMILEELGDLKIHDRERFLMKRFQEYPRFDRRLWRNVLGQLIVNGLVYEKRDKIGRGQCIALWEMGQSIDTAALYEVVKEYTGSQGAAFSIGEDGKIVRKPPFKFREDPKKIDKFNQLIDLGLIRLKADSMRYEGRSQRYYINYELTPLGAYCREIFSKCEIAQD